MQHARYAFLARVKVKLGKLPAMTVVLDCIVAATTMRRAVYHVLQGKHQVQEVLRAKIAQLGKRLSAAKAVVQGHTVVTAIQHLHAWTVDRACTTIN